MWDKAKCGNCNNVYDPSDLREIRHLWERVEPGDQFPAGQCPGCGALCFPVFSIEHLATRVLLATEELRDAIHLKFAGTPELKTPNDKRRAKVENALVAYSLDGQVMEETITDFITDLMHLAGPELVDRCVPVAERHYDVENECAGCRGIPGDVETMCDECQERHAADRQDAADHAREQAEDQAIEDEITATAEHLYGPVEGGKE